MKSLLKLRLSHIFILSFVVFMAWLSLVDPVVLTDGQIALFSVTSILFGFYFGPILSSQKTRVEVIKDTLRKEGKAILNILAHAHMLSPGDRHQLKVRVKVYLESIAGNTSISTDNLYYDELLRFVRHGKFRDDSVAGAIYKEVLKTQDNRDTLEEAYGSKLYSHEWMVMSVLFAITLYFILQTDYGEALFFRVMLAVLCAGLIMLVAILVKYATLTHKEAKQAWAPLKKLLEKHFEDIAPGESEAVKAEVDSQQG